MIARLNVWAWLGILALLISAAGSAYYFIYRQGVASEKAKQEKALNTLKEATDAIQDRALTTPTPSDELRKYARPD